MHERRGAALRTAQVVRIVLVLAAAGAAVPTAVQAGWGGADPSLATSPSPGVPWIPKATPKRFPPRPPADISGLGSTVSLAQVIDLALKNDPSTRAAWLEARAAAAHLKSEQGAYFPTLDFNLALTRQQNSAVGGQFSFRSTTAVPSLALEYLLFDFGGRGGDVEEARQALYAANWIHNAAIQRVILAVASEYYRYQGVKSLVVAEQANLVGAETNLKAAEARRAAGVASIADVLQARTAYSQAELRLETAQGLVQTIRGSLATELGVPANVPVDVEELPQVPDVDRVGEDIDHLISGALERRPDLLALRSRAAEAEGHVRSVRAEGLPSLRLDATGNRTYYEHPIGDRYSNNYAATLQLQVPVFSGFSWTNDLIEARELAGAARARAEQGEQQVILQVWTSYYDLKTAARQVKTSGVLLESARQSEEVSLGRYKAGVGGFLDLVTVQAALATARAQELRARADWFIGLAQLAHDTGVLEPGTAGQLLAPAPERNPDETAPKP